MNLNVQSLTTYKVESDGEIIALCVKDTDGNDATIRLNFKELGNLAIALPSVIELALRQRSGFGALRYAYPTTSWSVEASTEPENLILTLRTEDGFGVSFAVSRAQARELGENICAVADEPLRVAAH